MQSIVELYTPLQTLIAVVTQSELTDIILADQGTPAPEGYFGTYKPVPVRAVGQPRTTREDIPAYGCDIPGWTDFEDTIHTSMEFMISCNFFNEGAADAALKMHNANFREAVKQYLFVNNIGWRYCSPVRDLSEISQASMQPRYQIDLNCYIEAEVTEEVLRAAGFSLIIEDDQGHEFFNGVVDHV